MLSLLLGRRTMSTLIPSAVRAARNAAPPPSMQFTNRAPNTAASRTAAEKAVKSSMNSMEAFKYQRPSQGPAGVSVPRATARR